MGFHLSLLGKKIKLEEVFSGGYSGLLTLVWNLPSKSISLFNLNHLLTNQHRIVLTSSGLSVRVDLMGAISVDLSGQAEVSFWSMYAKTNLKLRFYYFFRIKPLQSSFNKNFKI